MEMTPLIEHNLERLERQQTQPKFTATGCASMMTLVFLVSQGLALPGQNLSPVVINQTDATAVFQHFNRQFSAIDLLNVLRTFDNKMLEQSRDLDADAREMLYKNLSKLYKYA